MPRRVLWLMLYEISPCVFARRLSGLNAGVTLFSAFEPWCNSSTYARFSFPPPLQKSTHSYRIPYIQNVSEGTAAPVVVAGPRDAVTPALMEGSIRIRGMRKRMPHSARVGRRKGKERDHEHRQRRRIRMLGLEMGRGMRSRRVRSLGVVRLLNSRSLRWRWTRRESGPRLARRLEEVSCW